MKIIAIFAEKLYACQYDNEGFNEYARLMNLWTNLVYLREYAKENKISDLLRFANEIREDAEFLQDLIATIGKRNAPLASFFKPLNNLETSIKVLSLQKGRRYRLRIYAIKLDENLFLITGGAIKLSEKLEGHPTTLQELQKLRTCQTYFFNKEVKDIDNFFEIIL